MEEPPRVRALWAVWLAAPEVHGLSIEEKVFEVERSHEAFRRRSYLRVGERRGGEAFRACFGDRGLLWWCGGYSP